MADYVINCVICDRETLENWLIDDSRQTNHWDQTNISFRRFSSASSADEYWGSSESPISYSYSTSYVQMEDGMFEIKFWTKRKETIGAVRNLLEVSHGTVWYAVDESLYALHCFYWDNGIKEKEKVLEDNPDEWIDEIEKTDPEYEERFEEPDHWIWQYVAISPEPWVECPELRV